MNKERTILYLFSINAIIYIASGFYTPFLSAYYAQKGIDAEKIGILLMIGPCVVLLTQRFWAKISDRTGKRKEVLLVTIVGSGFSMLLYYLGNSFLCMFFATVVVTSFTTAVIPLSDAILIARSLKEGYSYSIIRLGGTLGYAVMTICAGMYLKTRPQMQFVFAFFAYMILFCFCIGLKEERNGQIVINEVVQENEQNRIFKNRDVYIVLGLAFVSQMGLSFYTGFIGPYILEKGYTQSTIGVINSISALSEVPVLFYINRMLRKHGTIKILFLSCFLMGIRILLPIRSGIIGIVLAQLLQGVRCFPKPNGAERIQNLSWQGGGKVASGMVAAARLGLCCGIMGNVGDDKYGTFCLRDFQDHGIDTEQMCVRKNRTTNFDIVISDEGSMGRSFVFYPGNAECMTEEELNIEYISNSSYFYMANLDSVTKKAAQMAKQKGSKIFMDADSYTDELLDAISWIDIFIGSEFVYEKMLEAGKSVKENCEYLYNKGPEIVIFTFGEKGCAGISKEGFFEIPAFDVDVKDTVGAGDVFHGAFLAAIVKGLSPKDAARFASGVAAIKCTRIGGRAGIPNWEVTDNFLETGEIDYREIDERVKKYGRGIEYV